ncbi:uncharacterized protein LOC108148585 [Drosophila elegans]|uniref:uncharacterized protein LOC108148585 n=1 Tax=Drosophila elegans TaxID=30023 RepID=UPI0007E7808C|nr:uncharacterized protein LOC108148585 [Drosophila elegans]
MLHLVKGVVLSIAVVTIANRVCANEGDTIFGAVQIGAKIIHEEHIVEPKKFLRVVTRKFILNPQPRPISAIVIFDNSPTKGGHAYLLEGGPPANFAVIEFKSKRNQGLDFTLTIYDTPSSCTRCLTFG